MQVSPASAVAEVNGENLSLLRLLNPEVLADPYPLYRALREHSPVYWDPYMHAWIVTSYSEVISVLKNYSADRTPTMDHLGRLGLSVMKPFTEVMQRQMLFMDGAMHARLRNICAAAFTPRRVEELRAGIESIVDELIDKVISSGRMDMIADFANPLPAIITAKLLGVPIEDHQQLGAWVIDLAEVFGNFQHHPDRVAEIVQSLEDLKSYVTARMEEQHKCPTSGLIHSLMTAEVDGHRLSDDEVVANTIIMLVGGHETTTNLIASGFLTLLRNPESLRLLRDRPETVGSAVEELLRFESPVQHTARIAPADMQLGGKTIQKGSRVVAVLAAANRDPSRFPHPDRLDLLRTDNRHLAFGWAAHFCFGAPLARIEAQIAFNALLRRLSKPALLDKRWDWRGNAGLRGLTVLNLSFGHDVPTTKALAMASGQGQEIQGEGRKKELSEAKRRLLQQYLRGMAQQRENEQIRPRSAGATVPLSAEQRRIWLHASHQPDLPIYNEPFTIHRYGSFDLGILEASMNEVLRRHEAWRTSFSREGAEVIHHTVRATLPLLDLSGLPEAQREAEALRIATEDAQKPIPLHAVPLFRARVVRMKPDEHRLYLTFHHIVFDAISVSRIFVPELSAIYASLEQAKPSPLPPPALQYGDYAVWRERQVDSPAVKQHLEYWLEQLSGELPILRLPEDRPRPAITSHRGSMECFDMPNELAEDLRRLGRAQGVTLYMTMLAAFKVLLFRYSGQKDLIVGSVTDARRRPELAGVMGYFLDTFAIRTRPVAEMRFSEYLAQVRESVLGGLVAADVPFDRVVQEVNPKRDTSQHPIFQVFFSIRPPMPVFPEGWNLTQMDVTVGTSKFDLHLELCERPDHMEARFFYSTDTWDASTIRRMAAHWLVLLRSVCKNPESTLGALTLLTPEETVTLLGSGGWNDTARAFPQATLNTLIEDQVRRTPQAIAAAFGDERWTYEGLDCRAEAFASLLKAAGVGRGSIVAIALNRSLDLLAGLIAVLKTGAAYLPLDLQMPRDRIALCLADAAPQAILTQRSMLEQFASSTSAVVLVDGNRESHDLLAKAAPATEPSRIASILEDTAYLIYTSGSTGEPKAVEISQRSLINLLAAMQTSPGFGPEDVFLSVTPISFDIAALEMFLPIISGGTVVITSREEAQDPYLLAKAICRSGCTVMQATPATWRTLLLSGWDNAHRRSTGNSPRRLRILCGGELLPRELASRLLATGAEVWNMYGPTETTIWSLIHRVHEGTEKEAGPVSIGRPIANTTAYILDEQRQPLPAGVPGELFLGGVGLAKGYRGQPQRTADRFFRVESVGGSLLYRTGDVAVRRADGTIDVLGRTDNQVKVRGHRIELEAVEAAVLGHPHVAAAAARAWPEPTGDSRLSIYVVAKDEARAPSLAELRAFLGSTLPGSMIPSDVIPLPAIPLTTHGKADRARLPAPAIRETSPQNTTPCSPEEMRLAAIWADLLRRRHIGPDDNFFDLGGHSLLVAVLQQRIATEFGQRIPIAELFHSPTVRLQAELTQRLVKDEPTLPPGVLALQPYGTRDNIFWMHYVNGQLAKALGDDQPFLVVSLTADDIAALGEAPTLQSIATCHLRKILATQSNGPYTIGGQCAGGVLAYEIASQLKAAGKEVSLLVLLDAPNPSYLESCDTLASKLSYLRYLTRRVTQLGPRMSIVYLRELLQNRVARMLRTESARTEMRVSQEMIESAARAYRPESYGGKMLLVLASDRPPHRNFLPGWQAVASNNLHIQYVSAHHRDLIDTQNVGHIADAIARLISVSKTDEHTMYSRRDGENRERTHRSA
jgi:amino acid adenylation domain-containing protein